jgi:hypothetical protein
VGITTVSDAVVSSFVSEGRRDARLQAVREADRRRPAIRTMIFELIFMVFSFLYRGAGVIIAHFERNVKPFERRIIWSEILVLIALQVLRPWR